MKMEKMFCYQCQEAAAGKGCTIKGVCGKEPQTSAWMDLLIIAVQGLAIANHTVRKSGLESKEASIRILDALFTTITNANFDDEAIKQRITDCLDTRDELLEIARQQEIVLPDAEELSFKIDFSYPYQAVPHLNLLNEPNEDIRSLKQLILYGIKGLAAYTQHALQLGYQNDSLHESIESALCQISKKDIEVNSLISLALAIGEAGVKGMALLDDANTGNYGHPEITEVNLGVSKNPGILISGHDLKDMESLLEQTAGTGVDIYTHSEMLPAHYYPAFKKYPHFIGNYGNAWWKQREEFEQFNGVILFTTNCIVPPLPGSGYKERIYTTGSAGLTGATHIEYVNGKKDFSLLIKQALQCKPPVEIESGTIVGGFAHHQVLSLAEKVIETIKAGKIRKFVVMAGCDGRMKSRSYYTDFANALPKDVVILTAGCAKYKYNKLSLGDIEGIPRLLDAGQCNDSYSLVKIALALKEAFGLDDINDLPIVYNIAWYEQKAVIVLLALLSLGVKNIHLGPTLPAFLSPNVTKVLIDNFNISGISSVEEDIQNWIN